MSLTIFTGNQPRHLALVRRACDALPDVTVVVEASAAPRDNPSDAASALNLYFQKVREAERHYFGVSRPLPGACRVLPIMAGDLNLLPVEALEGALGADVLLVFGSSYIKGWLVEALISKAAINLHMGISPQYRGSACNFWALHDGSAGLVGATVHRLTRGLDDGDVLFHSRPTFAGEDAFHFTMKAVDRAQSDLLHWLAAGGDPRAGGSSQDRSLEVRYSRNADFTEQVAKDFLDSGWGADWVAARL